MGDADPVTFADALAGGQIALDSSWFNASTNLGRRGYDAATDLDFQVYSVPVLLKARLYDRDWLMRKIVRKLPETLWQDGIVFEGPSAEANRDRWAAINFLHGNDDGAVLNAAIMARLFGGALLLKGYARGGSLESPIRDGAAGELEFLDVLPAPMLAVHPADLYGDRNDPRRFEFPQWYRVTSGRFAGQRIHESRVIPFYGPSATPTVLSQIPYTDNDPRLARWGNSVVDLLHKIAAQYGITWASISRMIQETSLVWFKMQGLFGMIKANDLKTIDARLSAMSVARGPNRTLMLDADSQEEIGRLSVDYSGLDKVLHQLNMVVSAALDLPLNVFFGSVVGGLNASSDADHKLWNGHVKAYGERSVKPRVGQLMRELKIDQWRFRELDTPTADERAKALESSARVKKFYFDAGALSEETLIEMAAADFEFDVDDEKARIEKERKENEAKALPVVDPTLPPGAVPPNAKENEKENTE